MSSKHSLARSLANTCTTSSGTASSSLPVTSLIGRIGKVEPSGALGTQIEGSSNEVVASRSNGLYSLNRWAMGDVASAGFKPAGTSQRQSARR